MNSQHDDFVELRRLLSLKRHEQPPPGYFDGFSRLVVARIRAGEQVRDYSFFESWLSETSWFRRFWASLERRPVYAGAFGVAVCGLLLAGVLLSENTDPVLVAAPSVAPVLQPDARALQVGFPVFDSSLGQFSGLRQSQSGPASGSLFQRFKDSQQGTATPASASGSL